MHAPAEPATGNPIEPAPVSGRLPHVGLLRFAGPDALSFLQGQVSNDTRRLGTQTPLLAAYSTPQGRVIAVMHLIPHSSGIIALVPRDLVLPVLDRLRKYVLRSKVTIEDLTEQFICLGLHGTDLRPLGINGLAPLDAQHLYAEQGGVAIARIGADPNRCWVVGSRHAVEALTSASFATDCRAPIGDAGRHPGTLAARDWRLADIRTGIPQVYAATSELFVAQMLNLDLIDAISFTKGCFTGQEIVARAQHLGRIKRRMYRLRLLGGAWTIGQTLLLPDGRTGRLVELAELETCVEALAVLNTDISAAGASEALAANPAAEAVELALPYSLTPRERA